MSITNNRQQTIFELGLLHDHVQFLPIVAKWQYLEWGHLVQNDSIEHRMRNLQAKLQIDRLPLALVAFSGGDVFGSIDIVMHDLPTHQNLSPWLTNLFVEHKVRRNGIGTALIKYALSCANKIGVREAFLYTWDRDSLYRRLGWSIYERSVYKGKSISIMKIQCPQ